MLIIPCSENTIFLLYFSFLHFVGGINKPITPLALVGYRIVSIIRYQFISKFLYFLTEMFLTDNLTAALIVLMVANFLIRTCRARKAMELCQEGLSLVSKPELIKHKELCKTLNKEMYLTLIRAYFVTNGINILEECGAMAKECRMSMFLAALYFRQSKYVEAKQLLEKALLISTEIGDKKRRVFVLCRPWENISGSG